jgi:anthranilate 1,2-dioxygenase ferredoxin subunit
MQKHDGKYGLSETFLAALAENAISEGGKIALRMNGWPVLICRVNDVVFAVIDRCSHAASALSAGRLRGATIMCPLHGARFDLGSGRCLGGPHAPLKTLSVRIIGGVIEVAVPNSPPLAEHVL